MLALDWFAMPGLLYASEAFFAALQRGRQDNAVNLFSGQKPTNRSMLSEKPLGAGLNSSRHLVVSGGAAPPGGGGGGGGGVGEKKKKNKNKTPNNGAD